MENYTDEVIKTSIEVEELLTKLYRRFGKIFPEDSLFWQSMSHEEATHVLLLNKTAIPGEVSCFHRLHDLSEIHKVLLSKLKFYRQANKYDKAEVFEDALELEAAKAKIYFDIAKICKKGKMALKAFLFLNKLDIYNIQKIRLYFFKKTQVAATI